MKVQFFLDKKILLVTLSMTHSLDINLASIKLDHATFIKAIIYHGYYLSYRLGIGYGIT